MLRILACLMLLSILPSMAFAATCTRESATCVRTTNPTVDGVRLQSVCREVELEELCERDNPVNECVPFNAARITHNNALRDGECRRTSRECTRYRNGDCDRWLLKFTCWNGPLEHSPADLEDRVFHNFEERNVDSCGPLNSDPNCTRKNDVITEDYETRNINGLDVTRAWWRRDRNYDCTDPSLDETCGPFEGNPVCTRTTDELCLMRAPDGTCIHAQLSYDCDVDANFTASCQSINVCVGNNCTGIDSEASQDFPKAAAWLNVLDSMADDFGCSPDGDVIDPTTGNLDLAACPVDPALMNAFDPRLFTGTSMICNRGLFNCCDGDGQGSCPPEAEELANFRDAGVTHFVQSECTSEALGICLNVREYHCVYKSKFARVFQEQADLQTGVQFPSPHSVLPCPALDIYQLELLDVDAMDLSEVFGDLFDQIEEPKQDDITNQLTNGVTTFAPEVQDVFE